MESFPGYDQWKLATPPHYDNAVEDDDDSDFDPLDDGDEAYDRWKDDQLTEV